MREQFSAGPESLKVPTSAAVRLEGALKLTAPDTSPISRFTRVRSSSPQPILKYLTHSQSQEAGMGSHSEGITIAADYGLRELQLKKIRIPGFGLKVNGEERVYVTAGEIETLLGGRNGLGYTGKEEAEQNESLLLHGIVLHGAANRVLSPQIEDVISQAFSAHAQTVAVLEGRARVYFPFVPQEGNPKGAKMIQVVTSRTGTEVEGLEGRARRKEEVTRAHELTDLSTVRLALDRISDQAVILEEMSYGGGKYVQITDAKGAMRLVNIVTGAEFVKTVDASGQEHIVHELLSEELTGEILSGKKLMVVFGASGANAKNFSAGWKEHAQDLIIAGEGTKMDKMTANGVHKELLFNRDSESDHQRLDALLESGLVFAVYDSTAVEFRIPNLERVVPHLQSGKVERYVTTKPVARSLQDLLTMKRILRQEDANGKRLEERFFVHEHYVAKAP
ncbi:MAG: hypothetical protein KGL95_04260, partial [Patescibacteria group bacterium]|nr:hypothetical protein [Patescibacteria group bacterium]